MIKPTCTEERFLGDVAEHVMIEIKSEGLHRHLRFKRKDSIIYYFDIITWPGCLCISGDCGTYVFSRVRDMFTFFRGTPDDECLKINAGYWGEKLLSIGTNAGYTEFDEERFKERVKEHYDEWCEAYDPADADKESLLEAIDSEVLSAACDGEMYAYTTANNFSWDAPGLDFRFQDFFDSGGTERCTFSYLWCLYAIVWGIKQYDEAKK